MTTDVLIIGVGPTGLMAACRLARAGINFIIVDSKSGPTEPFRTIAITTRSLETCQQMGLAERVGLLLKSFPSSSKKNDFDLIR
ncbi:MAG: FAD-dependent oxidoreductase [Cytophagaceae bacterium]